MLIKQKRHLLLIFTSSLLSLVSIFSIIFFINPKDVGATTISLLYLSIFFGTVGFTTLIFYFFKKRWNNEGVYSKNLFSSLRQGILIAILLTVSLFFSSQNILFWWVEASMILFLLTIEAFFNLKQE